MSLFKKKSKFKDYSLNLPIVTDRQDNTGITKDEIKQIAEIAKGEGFSFRKFTARVLRYELIRRQYDENHPETD